MKRDPLLLNHDDPASVLEEEFWKFHDENPRIYELFRQFALLALERGDKLLGGSFILERIRWEIMITTTSEEFKISNNHSPYYARMFIAEFPEHRERFEFRRVQGEREQSNELPEENAA